MATQVAASVQKDAAGLLVAELANTNAFLSTVLYFIIYLDKLFRHEKEKNSIFMKKIPFLMLLKVLILQIK